jgi:hypothetical protein
MHNNAAVDDPFAVTQWPLLIRTAVIMRTAAANILSCVRPNCFITTDVGRCSNMAVDLASNYKEITYILQ